jgi:hypothetical protein
MQQLTAHDRVRIAATAIVAPRTVERVYAGSGAEYSRARVREAARALGLPLPPDSPRANPEEPTPRSAA